MVDYTKPIRMTDGRSVELVRANADNSDRPHIVVITDNDGKRIACFVGDDGLAYGGQIENVPEKRTVWLNVYANGSILASVSLWAAREHADARAASERTHILELDIDTGECRKHEVK